MWRTSILSARFASMAVLVFWAASARGHQLWIETSPAGRADEKQAVHVCWGHPGHKETGEALERQQAKLSAYAAGPGQPRSALDLALGKDSFVAAMTPSGPGYQMVGGEAQTGILTTEFHGIPAKTRIVMYGKSFTHVGSSDKGLDTPLGMDLEIVPVNAPGNLRPGDVVVVRVLFQGKPIGGRTVEVVLNTLGPEPVADDPRVRGLSWNVQSFPDPRTGEVSFPLIVSGQHQFYIRYTDETPGQYEGDLRFATNYSRLQKGEPYERTLYVSTFTFGVASK